MKHLILSLALAASSAAWAEVETYRIDPEHSFANWELRHIVARTSGTFHGVTGKLVLDRDNLARSSVEATINVYNLNSNHAKRDQHLLTDEFLDARRYPEMRFVSTAVQPSGPDKGTVVGHLTLHGATRQVRMEYQILGFGNDPWDGYRAGLKGTLKLNRADFGIARYADNGPVGNEVDITLLVEGIKLGPDGKPFSVKQAAEAAKAKAAPPPAPAQPASPQPAAPEKEKSMEEQLKEKLLKGIFN